MTVYKIFNTNNAITSREKEEILDFLNVHLDQYGDKREDIEKAIDFALRKANPLLPTTSLGGFVLAGYIEKDIVGAVVVNRTGMSGYIPENILVYIAVNKEYRGRGLGKELMRKVLDISQGDIALHVEADNPAKFLYEKVGFENKYLEMRYKSVR